jgi:hypothetical protein
MIKKMALIRLSGWTSAAQAVAAKPIGASQNPFK